MARFFCIFHALSFELNFFFDRRFPLNRIQKVTTVKFHIFLCNCFGLALTIQCPEVHFHMYPSAISLLFAM